MLVSKGLLGLQGVGRDAEDHGLALGKRAGQPCEIDGFLSAAGGGCARIEKQEEPSARVIVQRDCFAAVAGQTEARVPSLPLPVRRGCRSEHPSFPATVLGAVSLAGFGLAAGPLRQRPSGPALTVSTPTDAMLSRWRRRIACLRFELGFFAIAGRFLAADVFFAAAAAALPVEILGDFFCVFLDIRLPFVAFGRSIIRLLQAVS